MTEDLFKGPAAGRAYARPRHIGLNTNFYPEPFDVR
jgi:hypothetical protein